MRASSQYFCHVDNTVIFMTNPTCHKKVSPVALPMPKIRKKNAFLPCKYLVLFHVTLILETGWIVGAPYY